MTRRCSHCSNNGHNSRTCPSRGGGSGGGGVRLFGVRLTDGSIIKKSASMGNLTLANHHHCSSPSSVNPGSIVNPGSPCSDPPNEPEGYLSDDPANVSSFTIRRSDRKKGFFFLFYFLFLHKHHYFPFKFYLIKTTHFKRVRFAFLSVVFIVCTQSIHKWIYYCLN